MSFPVYSQKTILDKKDTLICFTVSQSKFLLKEHYRTIMVDSLNSICEAQLSICDSIRANDQIIYNNQVLMIQNKIEVIQVKDYEIGKLHETINDQKKTIRRQKTYKWLSIIGGGVLSGFLGYAYITK